MYGFRDGFLPRSGHRPQGGPLGGKVISLLAVAGLTGVGSGCAGLLGQERDGSVPGLEPPPFVETSYVARFDLPEGELPGTESSTALAAPSGQPIAAAYSRRYDISPELALDIVENAAAAGIDPELAFRLIRVESVFKVRARGSQGALGLMQLMPGTARSLDRSLDTEREILEPDNNLRVGLSYLRRMIERYDDVRLGLLAYNRGETAVDRALRRGVDPENGYSHKVLGTRGDDPYTGPGVLNDSETEPQG